VQYVFESVDVFTSKGETMKPCPRQCLAVLLALLVSPVAFAAIADEGNLTDYLQSTFGPGSGSGNALVESFVYTAKPESQYSGNFIYAYLISNARVNLSFFSVEILPGEGIVDYGWDTGGEEPFAWEPVNNPVESIEAFFKDPIESGGETSAMLWFISPHGPTEADGALAGITGGSYNFLVGNVLTPQVPEPATWMLLIGGGLLGRLSRKRK
jgi:hypothetical protein